MEENKSFSIAGSHKTKSAVEKTAQAVFVVCGFAAVLALSLIHI